MFCAEGMKDSDKSQGNQEDVQEDVGNVGWARLMQRQTLP
jgi:hypothetical protein